MPGALYGRVCSFLLKDRVGAEIACALILKHACGGCHIAAIIADDREDLLALGLGQPDAEHFHIHSLERAVAFENAPVHIKLTSIGAAKNPRLNNVIARATGDRSGHFQFLSAIGPQFALIHTDGVVAEGGAELGQILTLYGRMVSAGEWRDYGMSFLREVAVFSIFRRTAEHPIYQIEKRPRLRGRQGMYSVIAMDGRILKRGHDLKSVLRVLERKLIRAVD